MAKLQVLLPDGAATQYDLSDEQLSIGRGSNNTIKIDDQKASRNHCTITQDPDGFYYLKDLDSRNGTKLNGIKIGTRTKLKIGDVIRIGKTKFAFEKFPDNYNDDDDVPTVETAGETVAENKPKYVLEVIAGKSIGGIIELKEGVTTFGRKPSNDVTVDDDKASGNHCEVRKEAMGYILVDLDSTNGTRFRATEGGEFDKVTKAPLAVGSEIRIGATIYRYKNVGAPNPDDEVLAEIAGGKTRGTDRQSPVAGVAGAAGAATHTGKTVRAPRPVASPLAMGGLGVVVAVAALAVIGYFILNKESGSGSNGTGDPDVGVPPPSINPRVVLIKNANFQMPTNADGQPQYWTVGAHSKQKLSAVSDPKDGAVSKNMVAAVDRSVAGSEHALFEITSEHFDVEQGGAYGLTMRLRSSNDSEGPFGVKLQFLSTKDELVAEYPFLLTGSHDAWFDLKEPEFTVKAPGQKTYAQLVLTAIGNKGTVYFDDVRVRLLPSEDPPRLPKEVAAGAVQYKPRDFTGGFSVAIKNTPALVQGRLAIIDKKGNVIAGPEAVSLTDIVEKAPKPKIYNPMLNEWIRYEISAASSGKDIAITITPLDKSSDPAYHLAVLMGLGEGYVNSQIESVDASGTIKPLAGPDQGCQPGTKAQEILFSKEGLTLSISTNRPNLLSFGIGHLADKQRPITILCDTPTELFIGPDSQTLARVSAELLGQVETAIKESQWSAAEQGLKSFESNYEKRFPGLGPRVDGLRKQIGAAYETDIGTAGKAVPPGDAPISQAVANGVLPILNRMRDSWKGTAHEGAFAALIQKVSDRVKSQVDVTAEEATAKLGEKENLIAATLAESKTDDVVNKLTAQLIDYQAVIIKYQNTQPGKDAMAKLTALTNDLQRLTDEAELLDAVSTIVTAGEYQKARDFITAHPKYKKYNHPDSMPRLEAKLKRWAANQP